MLWRWLLKPLKHAEISMAPYLLRFLQADMLLLWDRHFLTYATVATVRERVARITANRVPLRYSHGRSNQIKQRKEGLG